MSTRRGTYSPGLWMSLLTLAFMVGMSFAPSSVIAHAAATGGPPAVIRVAPIVDAGGQLDPSQVTNEGQCEQWASGDAQAASVTLTPTQITAFCTILIQSTQGGSRSPLFTPAAVATCLSGQLSADTQANGSLLRGCLAESCSSALIGPGPRQWHRLVTGSDHEAVHGI